MSWQALDWVRRQRVGHSHSKAVLVQLANLADERGSCFPSHEYLAEQVEVTERTIQDCMKRLEADGYLASKRDRLQNGRMGLIRYTLHLNRAPSQPPEAASDGPAEKPPEENGVTTGSGFRSDPLRDSSESRERERAREVDEEHPTAAEALDAALKAWPNLALQNPDLALAAIERRSATDRQLLLTRIPDFLAFHKAEQPSAKLPFLHNYVAQENRWRDLPERSKTAVTAAPEPAVVKAFSRAWWWCFGRYVETNGASLRDTNSAAAGWLRMQVSKSSRYATAWPVDPARKDEIEAKAAAALVQHPRDGDHARLWRAYYQREFHVGMPTPDATEWVYLPSTGPPDPSSTSGLTEADRNFAAEGVR